MPKTIEVTVYRFSELSHPAQLHAIQVHQGLMDYSWEREALLTLRAMHDAFGSKLHNWQIDWAEYHGNKVQFYAAPMEASDIAARLSELGACNPDTFKGLGDCKLTGMCLDEDALDGIRIGFYRDGITDLAKLLERGHTSLFNATADDYADFYSDEQFSQHCDANDYWFTPAGDLI